MLAATTLRSATRVLSRHGASPIAAVAASASPQQQLPQRRGYHENIVEHYENPRNVGSLDKNDDDVGTVSFDRNHTIFPLLVRGGGGFHF